MENEKKKRRKKPAYQDWEPPKSVKVLYKIWMVVFSCLKIALGAAVTVAVICGVCALVFVGMLGDYLQDEIMPMAGMDLDDYDLELNSYVYCLDEDGDIKLLQNIFTSTSRDWAEYEEIPEEMIQAVVAIEDKRFFEHQGVDWVTTIKACARMFFGDASMGGSTITQQLIKNLTTEDSVTVQRKVLEIFRATEFEKRYDKKVVMEWYLNTIYLGQRCWGVKTAAATYYGKELQMLTVAECASLISITNNPSIYDPYIQPENNRNRQLTVLEEMKNQGWLTESEYAEAVAQEMVLKRGIDLEDRLTTCKVHSCGYTGTVSTFTKEGELYLCPECGAETEINEDSTEEVYSWFVDTVIEDVARDLALQDGITEWNDDIRKLYVEKIQRGGYHIYSTLDEKVQAALDAVYTDLSQIPAARSGQQLQSAMVIVDNTTGDIVAIAGGVGVKQDHDAFNRATDSKLQTGSSIKPLTVYAPAFEAGVISPCTVVKDLPLNYNSGTAWPRNDNREYHYSRTIFRGVVSSVNAVAAQTLKLSGVGYAHSFARDQFGLYNLTDTDIDYAPLAMGAQYGGITVREMACAFATFANEGVYREGRTYTKVYDSEGNLVLDNTQDSRQILSEKTVTYMNYCLETAVDAGTGTEANIYGQQVYGKTGTTASNRDRWFCGYTAHYSAAVWCGYDQPEVISMLYVNNPSAVLFRKVMTTIHQGLPSVNLYSTAKMASVTVCLDSGKLATEACRADIRGEGRVQEVLAYREDFPKDECDKHVMVDYCVDGNGVANEFCKHFAEVNACKIEQRALVKMTQSELDELVKAKPYIVDTYLQDNYVYLVDAQGKDGSFKGFNGDINKNINAPYMVCTVHTEQAWEDYHSKEPSTGGGSIWDDIFG